MPLETLTGASIADLLSEAQVRIGDDAVVLSVRKLGGDRTSPFELIAADPGTAALWRNSGMGAPMVPSAEPASPAPPKAIRRDRGGNSVIALVGPTGAGKTTTIAKLANHPDAFGGRSIGIVCLDTYRIGAIEQIRIFAELSHVPLEIVYEQNEIPRALSRLRKCEFLLVDTPGRGPRGQADSAATQRQLDWIQPDEIHLTLPAGLQPQRIRRAIDDHAGYGLTHMLVTKLDECPEDESIFRFAAEHRLPIRWVANGQEVPDDLEVRAAVGMPFAAGPSTIRGFDR
jgi:flagellar biosynthesis protein FlhF